MKILKPNPKDPIANVNMLLAKFNMILDKTPIDQHIYIDILLPILSDIYMNVRVPIIPANSGTLSKITLLVRLLQYSSKSADIVDSFLVNSLDYIFESQAPFDSLHSYHSPLIKHSNSGTLKKYGITIYP